MYEESKKCRICMQDMRRGVISITNQIPTGETTYFDIYKNISGLSPERGSQHLCKSCSEDLLGSFELKKKIEECEEFWKIEIKLEDEMGEIAKSPEEIEVKPDTDDLLFVSTLMNVEPSTSGKDYLKIEEDNMNNQFDFGWSDGDQRSESDSESKSESETEIKNTEKCPYCQGMYQNRKILFKHCRKKHSNKRMKCGDCDSEFILPYQLKKHRRSHHRNSDNDEILDKIKSSKSRSPKMDEVFECPFCPETFPVKHRLTIHKKEQHKGQRLPKKDMNEKTICPHCGLILFAKSLDKHTRQVHNKNPDEVYICDLCGAKVTSRNGIISHMQLKHLNIAYICRHCPEVFQNPGTRRTHEIRFHTLKYNFSCHICAKKFLTGVYLRKHLNSHTGERKHTCEICGMALATKESLKHHMATHSDARPYSCEICSATFKTTQTLRVHRKSHKEWDYECPVCERKFLVNQQLRQHVTRNHPEYELPPPGTVMNKSALKRIQEIKEKYNSDNVTVEMLGSFCKRRDTNRYNHQVNNQPPLPPPPMMEQHQHPQQQLHEQMPQMGGIPSGNM